MIDKKSSVPYIFACVVLALFLYGFHTYRLSSINTTVSSEIERIDSRIEQLQKDRFEKIELVFQSFFVKNDDLIKLFKSTSSPQQKQNAFKKYFTKELIGFKSYSIQSVQLYDSMGRSLFSNVKSSAVQQVMKKYQEFKGYEIINNQLALRVIKPYFDKQMNALGAIEFIVNTSHMLYTYNHQNNATAKMLFNKSTLQKHMTPDTLKAYVVFESNQSYLVHSSVYNYFNIGEDIYKVAFAQRKDDLIYNMSTHKSFAISFNYQQRLYSLVFIPLNTGIKNEPLGYIIAYYSDNHLDMLMKQHYQYMWLLAILGMVILVLYFFINRLQYKQSQALRLYENLRTDIDKYVIMTETDKQGLITYVSQAFCDVSGYTKEDLIGRPQSIVRHPDISKAFFKNMWEMLLRGESWEGEIKNMDKNGNSYWIKGIIVPILDENRKILGYRTIRVNITDEKQLQKVNSILKDDLSLRFNDIKTKNKSKVDESKIELMSQTLDAFANEWKKPISYISLKTLDLQTRLKSAVPDKNYLENFTDDINELIKSLSSNLNQFKYIFHNRNINERYNVYEEVKNAIALVYHDDSVTIELKGEQNVYSYGIANDLNKIVSSLLNNALEQFQMKHIRNGMIDIEILQKEDFIYINIEDNALGIPEDIMEKIFEPDFSTKDNFNSKGLSLYISKLMLQKNGGNLSVKNIDKGSCFTIELISKDRRKELT